MVSGKHEWIFRILNFVISIFGILAILRIFKRIIGDSFWGLFSAIVLFTSGIYVYYSPNFLMNITAFNMALIGWLLKITSLLSFFALCGLFILEWAGIFPGKRKRIVFKNKKAFIIPALIVATTIIAWISYIKYDNSMWNRGVFLVGILPVWDLSNQEISDIIENIRQLWMEQYFYRPLHVFFVMGLLSVWILYKRTDPVLLLLTSFLSVGFVAVVIFFFGALGHHDYYVIDLLILSVVLLFLAASHTAGRIEKRYEGWHNERHLTQFYGYAEIEPYLDSLGIDVSKKVISMNGPSVNITLYLINRQGWTSYGTAMNDSTMIARRIRMGAEYGNSIH